MSVAADRSGRPELPTEWDRLERAAEDAAVALASWKRRAVEAEEEVLRLRRTLEDLATVAHRPADMEADLRRLQAENAALHSRMLQASKRVRALLKRLGTLGIEI